VFFIIFSDSIACSFDSNSVSFGTFSNDSEAKLEETFCYGDSLPGFDMMPNPSHSNEVLSISGALGKVCIDWETTKSLLRIFGVGIFLFGKVLSR
jgi:hypothetical protein